MSDSSDSEIEPSDECDLNDDRKDSRSDSDSITSITRNKRGVKKLYRPSLGSKEKSTDRGTDMSEEPHKPDGHKQDKIDSHKSEMHKTESSSNTSSERKLPTIGEMVQNAILHLKDRKGSSAEAIRKYMVSAYDLNDEGKYSTYLKQYLRKAVNRGDLVQYRGQGGNGAFKLSQALKLQHKKYDHHVHHSSGSLIRHGTRPSRVPARNFSMIHSFKPNSKNQFKSSRFKSDPGKGMMSSRSSSRRMVSFVTPGGHHRNMKPSKGIRQISKNVVAKRGRPPNRDRHSKLGDPSVRLGGKHKKETSAPNIKKSCQKP
uniref:H15 domain-containing protein n=1 Tax=Strigamia maritima TaxID=126957 RepID=T1IIH0_STRMM